MLKRIIETKDLPISKRTRNNNPILYKEVNNQVQPYISATEFENFCKNDKIVDWFTVLSQKFDLLENCRIHPLIFLFQKGIEYEEKVINLIRQKTSLPLQKHSSLPTSREYNKPVNHSNEKKDMKMVFQAMQRGDSIIYSPYLCDRKECLRGIPDILIRNDYIATLFGEDYAPCGKMSRTIFGDYYYLPIEIKFSSIYLDKSDKYILNINRSKFYKTQLFTYCKILGELQGFVPRYAFIIGKRTVSHDKTIHDSIQKPGLIDYHYRDNNIVEGFYEGLEWLRSVKKDGVNWSMNHRLFPNMKNDHPIYQEDKKYISDKIGGDITEIWQCSTKNREKAFENGIFSWKDPRLNSDILGIADSYKESVDNIIKINRGELGEYYPLHFSKNIHNFKKVKNEMFVDFETVRDSLDLDTFGEDEFIFLIGVWYNGKYTSFMMKTLDKDEEIRVVSEFYTFWKENGSPQCWCWYAEKEMWDRSMKRNDKTFTIPWVDLYEVFYGEHFVVKGCKNFKLKSYVKTLSKLGKISAEMPPDSCGNGLDAMLAAWKYYHSNIGSLTDVIKYNELDCVYLEKLLEFIRGLDS